MKIRVLFRNSPQKSVEIWVCYQNSPLKNVEIIFESNSPLKRVKICCELKLTNEKKLKFFFESKQTTGKCRNAFLNQNSPLERV